MRLIQVFGPGCARCETLVKNAERAVEELGIEATVEKVSDVGTMAAMGIMMPPALAVDGEVKLVGKVASAEEIKRMLA